MSNPTDSAESADYERSIGREALRVAADRFASGATIPPVIHAQAAQALGLEAESLRLRNVLAIERSTASNTDHADALRELAGSIKGYGRQLAAHTAAIEADRVSREKQTEMIDKWAPRVGAGVVTVLTLLGAGIKWLLSWFASSQAPS